MRADVDLDERVAILAAAQARCALALEPQHLPVADALRHGEVERATLRHGDALLGAANGFHEVHFERVAHVLAPQAEAGTACAAGTEEIREDVCNAGIASAEAVCPAAAGPCAIARVRAHGLALGVDLAVVVAPPLGRIAENVVGGRHPLEAFARGRIIRAHVGMQLLGEPPVGPPDLVILRAPGYAQNRIEVIRHEDRVSARLKSGTKRKRPLPSRPESAIRAADGTAASSHLQQRISSAGFRQLRANPHPCLRIAEPSPIRDEHRYRIVRNSESRVADRQVGRAPRSGDAIAPRRGRDGSAAASGRACRLRT